MRSLETRIPPPALALLHAGAMWLAADRWPTPALAWPGRVWLVGVLVLVGLSFDLSGLIRFVKARTTINPMRPQKTSALVTTGVYRLTRNPMYVGMLCLLTAWGLWLAHPAALVALPSFVLLMNRLQIGPEERMLAGLFGEDYAAYTRAVRRWL